MIDGDTGEENIIIEDVIYIHTIRTNQKQIVKKKTSCNIISYLQDSNIEKVEKVGKLNRVDAKYISWY